MGESTLSTLHIAVRLTCMYSVPITGLTLSNVHGTVSSSGYDVYILCASGACSNWTWTGVSVIGGKKDTACENVPSSASC